MQTHQFHYPMKSQVLDHCLHVLQIKINLTICHWLHHVCWKMPLCRFLLLWWIGTWLDFWFCRSTANLGLEKWRQLRFCIGEVLGWSFLYCCSLWWSLNETGPGCKPCWGGPIVTIYKCNLLVYISSITFFISGHSSSSRKSSCHLDVLMFRCFGLFDGVYHNIPTILVIQIAIYSPMLIILRWH